MNKQKRGFTLIELLITVSIIAVMTAIGVTIYGQAIKLNRDQVRLKHLSDLKVSLDTYRYEKHQYPTTSTLNVSLTNYVSKAPVDPLSPDRSYIYKALPTGCDNLAGGIKCSSFVYCALKEGTSTYTNPAECATLDCKTPAIKCNMGVTSE